MDKNKNIVHAFRLRLAKTDESSIFLWPLIPDSIVDLQPSESGGANVTAKLTNGESVTHTVVESVNEIQRKIEECKELDKTCQHYESNP